MVAVMQEMLREAEARLQSCSAQNVSNSKPASNA
jgi:hypothetical protein